MKILVFLFLTFAALASCQETDDPEEHEDINISTKCAAVLVVAGTTVGAGLTYALTPAAICAAGFCPVGVAGSSFASWYQSTLPLVAKGSLFAKLQALAMGGVGTTTVTVGGGVIGGLVGTAYLKDFCAFVDETDPDSAVGQAFIASEALVNTAIETKIGIEAQCASSETCTAVTEAASEAGSVAAKSISSLWNRVSTGISNAATRTQLYWDILLLRTKIRTKKEEFGVRAFNFLRQLKKEPFTDVELKKIYGARVESVRRLESEIKENQSKDAPAYSISHLERDIEKQKAEFGVQMFDYVETRRILDECKSTELETLVQMFQESSEKVHTSILLLEEKHTKLDEV